MKNLKLILALVLVIALSAVVFQNRENVQINFLWLTGEMPAIILLSLTTAGGVVLGLLVSLILRINKKPKK